MKITWYGHSCFLVETKGGSVVFDPYSPGSVPGLTLPPLRADAVVCSHEHRDHCYSQAVTLSGRGASLNLRQIDTWHDERSGCLRGSNRITVLESEDLRLAHLGDLGHMLSPEQRDALGPVDVLLIPVGGYYTIDAATAAKLAEVVGARITVPMHYRGEGFGYEVISTVEDFLRLSKNVIRLDSNVLEPERIPGRATVVLRCPVD